MSETFKNSGTYTSCGGQTNEGKCKTRIVYEEKGQVTPETVDGVCNNGLMWERPRGQVQVDTPE